MRLGECPACRFGNHKQHVKHYDRAPEGMMGGAMCSCKGECADRAPQLPSMVTLCKGRHPWKDKA